MRGRDPACVHVSTRASPGSWRPPQGPFWEHIGCSLSLMRKVLGGGAAGSPPGFGLPKVPKVEPLKLAEAFLAPAVAKGILLTLPLLFQWEVSV